MPYKTGDINLVLRLNIRIKKEGIKYVNFVSHEGYEDSLLITFKIDSERHMFVISENIRDFDFVISVIKEEYERITGTGKK